MVRLNCILLAAVLLAAVQAHAQYESKSPAKDGSHSVTQTDSHAVCPWLSVGSAAHALGGDVSVTVNVPNLNEGSCRFLRSAGPAYFLEILVGNAASASCPAGAMQLRGIGNEATRCELSGARSESVDMIGSRVRDTHFTVTLALHGQKKSQDAHDDALEQVAEQVAGSLY